MRYVKETVNSWWGEKTNQDTLPENTRKDNLPVPPDNTLDVTYHAKQLAKGLVVFGAGVLGYVGLRAFWRSRQVEETVTTNLAEDTNSLTSLTFSNDFFFELPDEKAWDPTALSTARTLLSSDEKREVQEGNRESDAGIPYRFIDPTSSESSHLPITVTGYQAGPEFRLSPINTTVYLFAMTPLAKGGFVMLWSTINQDQNATVYGQVYNATGQAVSNKFRVGNSSSVYTFSVAGFNKEGFVAIWQDEHNVIQGQIYNETGQSIGNKFQVGNSRAGAWVSATRLIDGDFVAAWVCPTSSLGIELYKRQYNAMGQTLEPATLVESDTVTPYPFLSVTYAIDNGCVDWR